MCVACPEDPPPKDNLDPEIDPNGCAITCFILLAPPKNIDMQKVQLPVNRHKKHQDLCLRGRGGNLEMLVWLGGVCREGIYDSTSKQLEVASIPRGCQVYVFLCSAG